MIKPAYSVSFLLSINIFVLQNVLYFPNDPRTFKFPSITLISEENYGNIGFPVVMEIIFCEVWNEVLYARYINLILKIFNIRIAT